MGGIDVFFILIAEFTVAFLVTCVFAISFYLFQGKDMAHRQFAALCMLIFLGTWAGGVWFRPFGSSFGSIFRLSYLLSGLAVSIPVFLFFRKPPPYGRKETIALLDKMQQEKKVRQMAERSVYFYLRFLLIFLAAAIIIRYITVK
jgi:hypothetical protein